MSRPRLKPCPFCGARPRWQTIPADEPDTPNAGGMFSGAVLLFYGLASCCK